MRRASTPIWLFVLLACIQTGAAVADILSLGPRSAPIAMSLALHAGYACALTLLPAGILIWRSDAWHSARLVLVGSIIWTTVPSAASLGWWLARRTPALEDSLGFFAVGVAVAAVLAGSGPLAMGFGLQRIRRTRTGWLWPLTQQAGAIIAIPAMYGATRSLPLTSGRSIRPLGGELDAFGAPGSIAGAAGPVELFGLAVLACVCVSALLTQERQRRLWQCAAAGAALLLAVSLYEFVDQAFLGNLAVGDLERRGWYALAATAALASGSGLIALGFTSAVWSGARDAEGPARGAPGDVFAWGPWEWGGSEPIPMQAIVAVAAGVDHGLALDDSGRVGAWGDDSMGQANVPAGLSGVVAVAAGDGFSLALRADGIVVAWGANDRGQTDVPLDLDGVTAIAAGRGFALALKSDGSVVGWGDTAAGALDVPRDLAGVAAICAGAYHALALRLDGKVVAWGDNSRGQSEVPARLPRVKAISAGDDFSLALLADGTVTAWGDDRYGQLDIPEGLRDVIDISAGAFHAVALLAGGDILGWGGGNEPETSRRPWHLVDFRAVAAGDGFSLAIRAA